MGLFRKKVPFWDILGNEKLLMKNFGKIWDYSGKKSRFGIFWEMKNY